MQYWDIVQRSFQISWRRKYLWLLALFSGEGGVGFNFGYQSSQPVQARRGAPKPSDFGAIQQQTTDWLNSHIGLIVGTAALAILVLIGLFILAAVCEGALVRASAEHDAERPFRLGMAWRTGRMTMGTVIRFRLLLIALALPLVVLFLGLATSFVIAIAGSNFGAVIGLILFGFLLILVSLPYVIYLSFLDRLGVRAAVLEQLGARAAIVRAHRLLFKRLGRVLLVWLIAIGIGIAVAIGLAVVAAILTLPLLIAGVAAISAGSAPVLWLVVALGLVVVLPILLVVEAFMTAAFSTYWTLAFRRLEIDPAPAPGYAYPPRSPQPGPA